MSLSGVEEQSEGNEVRAEIRIGYIRRRQGNRVKVYISRLAFKSSGETSSLEETVFTPNSVTIAGEIHQPETLSRSNRHVFEDVFGKPIAFYRYGPEGNIAGRTITLSRLGDTHLDSTLVENTELFHAQYSRSEPTWSAPLKVPIGRGYVVEGAVLYIKGGQERGRIKVKVSGTLNKVSSSSPGGPAMSNVECRVVGYQVYDTGKRKWIEGELSFDLSLEVNDENTKVATLSGKLKATLTESNQLLAISARRNVARRIEGDPWSGFQVASWTALKGTAKSGREGKDEVTRLTTVITSVDAEGYPRKRFFFVGPEKKNELDYKVVLIVAPPQFSITGGDPIEKGMKKVSSDNDVVQIGEKKFSCTLTKYTFHNTVTGSKGTLFLWTADKVGVPIRSVRLDGRYSIPGDVIRLEKTSVSGELTEVYRLKVKSLRDPVTVAGRQIFCVLEELSVTERGGGRPISTKARRWLSLKVPGGLVRMEETWDGGETIYSKIEVEDFWIEE